MVVTALLAAYRNGNVIASTVGSWFVANATVGFWPSRSPDVRLWWRLKGTFYLRRINTWAELWRLCSTAVTLTVGYVPGTCQCSRNSEIAGPGFRYAIEITESIVSNFCEDFVGLTTLVYWNTADQINRRPPQLHWLSFFCLPSRTF
jgi:hypothetical protein